MSYKPQSDPSLFAVFTGNILSIILAVMYDWPLGQIMWIYWAQSVTIGVMNVIRMLSLKEFSTENLTMNDQPVPETAGAKVQVATFFAIHFGFFHFGYAVFLWQQMPLSELSQASAILLMLCISGFVCSHCYSFLHNQGADFKQKKPNLGTLMFYPYMRIIPMHLTILLGGMWEGLSIVIFMSLKTAADMGMHIAEHHLFQKSAGGPLRMRD